VQRGADWSVEEQRGVDESGDEKSGAERSEEQRGAMQSREKWCRLERCGEEQRKGESSGSLRWLVKRVWTLDSYASIERSREEQKEQRAAERSIEVQRGADWSVEEQRGVDVSGDEKSGAERSEEQRGAMQSREKWCKLERCGEEQRKGERSESLRWLVERVWTLDSYASIMTDRKKRGRGNLPWLHRFHETHNFVSIS
jgi:hypothetical protein